MYVHMRNKFCILYSVYTHTASEMRIHVQNLILEYTPTETDMNMNTPAEIYMSIHTYINWYIWAYTSTATDIWAYTSTATDMKIHIYRNWSIWKYTSTETDMKIHIYTNWYENTHLQKLIWKYTLLSRNSNFLSRNCNLHVVTLNSELWKSKFRFNKVEITIFRDKM